PVVRSVPTIAGAMPYTTGATSLAPNFVASALEATSGMLRVNQAALITGTPLPATSTSTSTSGTAATPNAPSIEAVAIRFVHLRRRDSADPRRSTAVLTAHLASARRGRPAAWRRR